MALYFMFGKYTSEAAMQGMSAKRTQDAFNVVKKFRGEVKGMYTLLGEHDLVIIAELPGAEEAVKASVALGRMSGVSFRTSPALPVEEFDKMIDDM